ncbi:MAG TPA: MFS transporter [Acidimicrobiales bacterium]|jgi:MFS family permease|nr:MFS transporter [Acidimicrobiales bacterium]
MPVLADITPLRESRDFRRLYFGQLVSLLGTQVTVVAVAVNVYDLTNSSLQVGLVSLAQIGPLIVGSILGGAVADAVDRRRLLLWSQVLLGLTSLALVANAAGPNALWPVYVVTAAAAGISGFDRPARSAALPGLVSRAQLSNAYALWQVLIQAGAVVGPAVAGLLVGHFGVGTAYALDAVTFGVAFVAVWGMSPLPPEGGGTRPGLSSITEGFRFVRQRQELVGVFVIDINAMVFGLPRAVFPALAERVFGGGASTVGLLYAAPGAGALVGALTTGWVGRIRRQGMAVLVCVAVWGGAMALFGLTTWLPLALALLAIAGAADVISAVFRNTILQLTVPDNLRGRLSAVQIAVVTGGPRLGDVEAGAAAALVGTRFSVVSGGLACMAGVALCAWLLPGFRKASVLTEPAEAPPPLVPEPPPAGS